jgi:hypothetical protein
MAKLSLNKAAAYAGKAKADLLRALKSNDPLKKLSGEKNQKGHWEIDESELDRLFGQKGAEPVQTSSKNGSITPGIPIPTSALEVEVKMLREQIDATNLERAREREQLEKQIESLRDNLESQGKDHRQALAVLTDQRPEKRGWFTFGRKVG